VKKPKPLSAEEVARRWCLARCAAMPKGEHRIDVDAKDEPTDPPCDCLASLTRLLQNVRTETLAEAAEATRLPVDRERILRLEVRGW
jgi:hypothetical protein